MPQNRRNSKEDFDAINPSFPPPSRINTPQSDSCKESDRRKKKEKKWSLGGLFRRRKTKESDTDTSSPTEEEEKKGFLERRKSARKKRNRGSKDVTGSFEHVVVHRNSGDVNSGSIEKCAAKDGLERLSVRSSHESVNKKQDVGQFHGSSASLEGSGSMRRSGRMKIMARVEANRDRLRADSSSDEGGSSRSRHSVSSTQQFRSDENLGSKDGSLSRKSRAARTERYIKRLSKDEEGVKALEVEPLKVSRSDERLSSKNSDVKIASGNRWTAKVVYYESSDYETKYTAKTKSATPSPIQSPKFRPKNVLHQTTSAPPVNIYTTFPPSHNREGVIGSHQELRSHSFQGGAFQRVAPKSASMQKVNENHMIPKLPKSKSDVSHKPFLQNSFQKQTTNWDQKLPSTKSASFDSSINVVNQQFTRTHPSDSNILVVQFPISRPNQMKELKDYNKTNYQPMLVTKQNPPPPPPRDPQRRILNSNGFQQDSNQRPMSYAFESRTHPQQPKLNNTDYNKSNSQLPNYVKSIHPLPISKHHRSNSDQQLLSQISYLPKQSEPIKSPNNKSELLEHSPPQQSKVPQHYQYYTDQQPRSRKPIHIAYNNSQSNDQPYLSDSQVVVKPPYQQFGRVRPVGVQNASDFWRQKEQETSRKLHLSNNSPKVIKKHLQSTGNSIASNSPRHENNFMTNKLNLPPIIMPIRRDESTSSLSGQSDISSPRLGHQFKISHNEIGIPLVNSNGHIESLSKKDVKDLRPLSMVLEKSEISEHETALKREKSIPPAPPIRRYSKQNSVSSTEAVDILGDDSDHIQSNRKSSNLEEALNELEAIYKSLRLGEEDLLEKAERRERLAYPDRLDPKNWNAWVQSRGFESDSSFNYSRSSIDSVDSSLHKNISDIHKPCEPDRVADDMAYRRLNKKDRPASQEHDVISQAGSFLLVSPTLSPPPFAEAPPIPLVKDEPDVTLDDVVYRNIKHVNNTLKVLDPQPLFGIPLGPISPAPNSDYLHITPKERYKSTFKPRKTPDVVTDDLAFRNLRKDNSKDASLYNPEENTLLDVPNLKKKRAIRSLSANLLGIIQKESYSMSLNNNNSLIKNNNDMQSDFEKSQSITDLPDTMISHRRRDNKENLVDSNIRQYSNIRKFRNLSEDESDCTVRDGRSLVGDGFLVGMSTSTETLTDSRANLQSHESKTRNQKYNWLNRSLEKNNLPPTGSSRVSITPERNQFKNGVQDSLSTPQSSHLSHSTSPRTSVTPERKQEMIERQYSPVVLSLDNIRVDSVNQTESDLLAILAKEARATSEQLGRELKELNEDKSSVKKFNKSENNGAKHIGLDQSNKSSLSIGKVVHHKPVKLNTFFITEDKNFENKKTTIESAPVETSKSMTDLLKELTRSLDNDFGAENKKHLGTTLSNSNDNEFNSSQHSDIKINRTKNIEELSDDSNSESINTICQSASSLTALSNSPLRGLSPLRKSKENIVTPNATKSLEKLDKRLEIDSEMGGNAESTTTDSKILSNAVSSNEFSENKLQENLKIVPLSEIAQQDNTGEDNVLEVTISGSTHCSEIINHESNVEKTTQLEDRSCQPLQSNSEGSAAKSANQINVSEIIVSSEEQNDVKAIPNEGESSEQGAAPENTSRPLDCSAFADEGIKMSNRTGLIDASTLLLVCSYCMACVHQLAGLDNLTILGIVLAIASVLLFLIC